MDLRFDGWMDANYMQPLRVEDLARQVNLDRRYLSRRFKQQTGLTLQEYIIQVRIRKLCQIVAALLENDLTEIVLAFSE